MFRITAAQFAPDLRVKVSPEAQEIRRDLYRALIRSEQFHRKRHCSPRYGRRLLHSKEILQSRSNRRGLPLLIFNFGPASARQRHMSWRYFVQQSGIDLRLERKEQPAVPCRFPQFRKTRAIRCKLP
jgi:hypothetical protein